jgi:hypothetical protein
MSFLEGKTDLTEESLGRYSIGVLNITAGPLTVVVAPVGTMIVGATGRVDMYRQGRIGEFERIVLLRQTKSASDETPEWKITLPMSNSSRGGRTTFRINEREPFTKATLEQALEFLLRKL